MICKKCGKGNANEATVCTNCGYALGKKKPPIYKKWWFWAGIVLVVFIIGFSSGDDAEPIRSDSSVVSQQADTAQIVYEAVDLQTMFDELESNALKAENTYKGKYVEVEGKIKNFDSNGSYISIEPINASEWNFSTAMCYIKNDTQKEFLMEKTAGSVVTIKGKVKSIGEVLGYSIDIEEIE